MPLDTDSGSVGDDWTPLPDDKPEKLPTNAESWRELAKNLRSHLQERALLLSDLNAEHLLYFARACRDALQFEQDATLYAKDVAARRHRRPFD